MQILAVASIALGLASVEAVAQEIKGAPDALIGYFGISPKQCRSYHRKSDDVTHITKTTETSCGGSGCGETEILSHRKTKDGYVLKCTSRGNPNGWVQTYRQIDDGVFEMLIDGFPPHTLVKCSTKDAIAGIGRDSSDDDRGRVMSTSVAYSAFYAQAVPEVCPDLKADQTRIEKVLLVSHLGRVEEIKESKFLDPRKTPEEQLISEMRMVKNGAEYDVRADAKEIPDFCIEVLSAFSSDGHVIPNLIKDPRKRL